MNMKFKCVICLSAILLLTSCSNNAFKEIDIKDNPKIVPILLDGQFNSFDKLKHKANYRVLWELATHQNQHEQCQKGGECVLFFWQEAKYLPKNGKLTNESWSNLISVLFLSQSFEGYLRYPNILFNCELFKDIHTNPTPRIINCITPQRIDFILNLDGMRK